MTDPIRDSLTEAGEGAGSQVGTEIVRPAGGCGRAGCGFLAGVLGSAIITIAILATILTRGHPLAFATGLFRASEATTTPTPGARLVVALGATPSAMAGQPSAGEVSSTSSPTATNTYTPVPTAIPTNTPTPRPTSTPTPTPTPTPIISLRQVNELGRYESMQFVVQTVIDLAREPNNLWERICGSDQLLLVAGGEVIAGFDLSKVRPGDVQVTGRSLRLQLPPAEIFSYFVREDQTYVYLRNTGLLCSPDPNLETDARRQAEQRLLDYAMAQGILSRAEKAGLNQLRAFFRDLGFERVELTIRPQASTD